MKPEIDILGKKINIFRKENILLRNQSNENVNEQNVFESNFSSTINLL